MAEKLSRALQDDPGRLAARLFGKLQAFWLSLHPHVVLEGRVRILGVPMIDIRKGSKLTIGNGVILTSRNRGDHLNIAAPV